MGGGILSLPIAPRLTPGGHRPPKGPESDKMRGDGEETESTPPTPSLVGVASFALAAWPVHIHRCAASQQHIHTCMQTHVCTFTGAHPYARAMRAYTYARARKARVHTRAAHARWGGAQPLRAGPFTPCRSLHARPAWRTAVMGERQRGYAARLVLVGRAMRACEGGRLLSPAARSSPCTGRAPLRGPSAWLYALVPSLDAVLAPQGRTGSPGPSQGHTGPWGALSWSVPRQPTPL